MEFLKSRRSLLQAGVAGLGASLSLSASRGAEADKNPRGIFNVRDFGASADGRTLATKALQAAIDAAATSGGVAYFPPGKYLSGTLFLKSHVSLRIDAGATLLGSTNPADYPSVQPKLRSYTDTYVNQSLIYAEDLEHVTLEGRGVIDGQGGKFVKDIYPGRPYLIRMVNCRNVRVNDLTLLDSPMWVQHYMACEDLCIRGLTVHSRCNANNDGIDIDACQKVRISDCEIVSGDDSIVLKSTLNRPCRDVAVTNCVVSSLCNGLKLGTESVGGFDNIVFSNCTVYDTSLSGIALESVDGGALENVQVSNIVMRNTRSAIFLRLGNRARPAYEGAQKPGLGSFRNVVIDNVQANGANKVGCAIAGIPDRHMENVTLANIRIQFQGGGSLADAGRDVPEKETGYPEFSMFGVLPAYAFYCRHVHGIRLLNIRVGYDQPEMRPALVCEDVNDLRVWDFEAGNSSPLIVLNNSQQAWLQSSRSPKGNDVYVRINGKQTDNIRLLNCDTTNSRKPVDIGSDVSPKAVLVSPALQSYE